MKEAKAMARQFGWALPGMVYSQSATDYRWYPPPPCQLSSHRDPGCDGRGPLGLGALPLLLSKYKVSFSLVVCNWTHTVAGLRVS